MPDVMIYGDTVRHSAMRHEIPLLVPDPFLYVEVGGERARSGELARELADRGDRRAALGPLA